jgi:hemoglobin
MESVYEAAGGELGLLALARAWHERVMLDEVVAHAFHEEPVPDHTERLAAYWSEALGGPEAYTGRYGDETAVVRVHSGNGRHDEMNERAVACFDQAMTDVGLDEGEPVRRALHDYFAWVTWTTLDAYHDSPDDVPGGLTIPHWSWEGLVDGEGL